MRHYCSSFFNFCFKNARSFLHSNYNNYLFSSDEKGRVKGCGREHTEGLDTSV